MQVILKEDIVNLGFKNDIVTVRDGYGRNYLIPRGLAVIASESAKKVLAEDLKQRAHKMEAIKKMAEDKAAQIANVKLEVKAKTSKHGIIFGSVNTIQLAEAFQQLGHDIDRKSIYLKNPIKEVGEYSCEVRLHREVSVVVPIVVTSENYKEIERKDQPAATENAVAPEEAAPVAEEATEESAS